MAAQIKVELYGISTCESCRKARKWLDAHSFAYDWVDLRESQPAEDMLNGWVSVLGSKRLRNTSGGSYRALGAKKQDWDETQWTQAFSHDPMLIKRPVLIVDGVARHAGFKDELYASLLVRKRSA